MTATHYLACDLGAESGRLILGTLQNGTLALQGIHRFPNTPEQTGGSLHWNIQRLFEELKAGLRQAAATGLPISSLSTDSWGVDYALFAADGSLIPPTFHYRDARMTRGVENALAKVKWEKIFAETGIQFMPMNTIFQLAAETPERLKSAALLLGIGDAFNCLLSGVARAEESLASTFQLYNPLLRQWSEALMDAVGLPGRLFPRVIPSGSRLGPLRPDLAHETGLAQAEVIASCSHDTGAAVAAAPVEETDEWAYISSGTWSLMGVEMAEPIINDACRELNFTNEIGYGGSVRLLKNIIGLWLVQECRRAWAKQGNDLDYGTLTRLAATAPAFVSLINPADPRFLAPQDMPAKIAAFCRETQQPVPTAPGPTIRCILESLALLYRRTLLELQQLTARKIQRVHIVGGGSQNALLNQCTANAFQLPVFAGPVEATAAGNILVQTITLGHIPSLSAGRALIRASFPLEEFNPQEAHEWSKAYERFERLLKG